MAASHVLSAHDSTVLLVDMQARLLPAIADAEALVERTCRFLSAAQMLQVPVIATEHCADKIGATDLQLVPLVDHVVHKVHFDATREAGMAQAMPAARHHVLVLGIEAHICVLQTALGLKSAGLTPWFVADCLGSRKPIDLAVAMQRWQNCGGNVLTSEMAVFEWLGSARHPHFRAVLELVKGASVSERGADTNVSNIYDSTGLERPEI